MKLLKENKFLFWVFVGTFIFFFIPRFFYIHLGLPHYSIDENDIVEFAIGYFGGDLNPYWYKYGPLYSYLLAIIYSVQSWFFEGNLDQHAEYYFSNNSLFYFSARFFNSVVHIALAFMAFAITHKFISKKTAPFVLIIALIPFSDLLTGYTIRVDSLLALNLILALFFSLHFLISDKLKWFVLTGLFIGFAFGTKPLPSLMILPTVYLSWILATINKKITFGNAIVKSILEYRLYVLVLFILVGLFISHPYAIINFKEFFNEQLNVIKDDSSFGWEKGYVVSRFFPIIGLPFVLISGIAVLLTFYYSFSSKKWAPFLLASFVLVFWGAFANAPAREYFYVPIIPVLCVLIGYLFNKYTTNFKYVKIVSLVLILILGFIPIKSTLLSYSQYGLNLEKLKDTESLKAEKWVYENFSDKDHVKGAFKCYRYECFKQIGGLKESIGWDSVDELLAKYYGWDTVVNQDLVIKHLRPLGTETGYVKIRIKIGHGFYRLRYGFFITCISAFKTAFRNKPYFISGLATIYGFLLSWIKQEKFIVNNEQGIFIRKFRYQRMKEKITKLSNFS